MIKKKILAASLGTAIAASALLVSFAGAQTNGVNPPMSIEIGPKGNANLKGTVASIGSNSITVTSWGGAWTINISGDTNIVRRFGATSTLSEFAVGDMVQVNGVTNTSTAWTIDARKIRNNSIQARNADFSGVISNLNGSAFTLTTEKRGAVNVTVNADAKIIIDGSTSTVSGLANGMKASVKGVWDRALSKVMASRVVARTATTNATTTQQ